MANVTGKMYTKNGDIYYPRPYYRIGDILESTNPNNPADDGYIGTWELYGIGRTTVCIDTNDNDFNTAGKQIGEKSHKLTNDEMPKHNHSFNIYKNGSFSEMVLSMSVSGNAYPERDALSTGANYTSKGYVTLTDEGGNGLHNNIQPSIVVYRWRRIA